jgi:hypothetical protein
VFQSAGADGPPARNRGAAVASNAVAEGRWDMNTYPGKSAGYMVAEASTRCRTAAGFAKIAGNRHLRGADVTRRNMHSRSVAPWTHSHAFLGARHDEHERRREGLAGLSHVTIEVNACGGARMANGE